MNQSERRVFAKDQTRLMDLVGVDTIDIHVILGMGLSTIYAYLKELEDEGIRGKPQNDAEAAMVDRWIGGKWGITMMGDTQIRAALRDPEQQHSITELSRVSDAAGKTIRAVRGLDNQPQPPAKPTLSPAEEFSPDRWAYNDED